MYKVSEALERQISRIHELLERSHECVTWNDHIPDPDNPEQLRQIDVTIRNGDELTVIECRVSQRPQNVKWIEELIGRRASLGAQQIIGVSSAGFTKGAQRKAARYAVGLHDLRQVADEDIASWGKQVSLKVYYYQYSEVTLGVGFAHESVAKLETNKVTQELRSHHLGQSAFNAAATKLDELKLLASNDTRSCRFGVRLQPEAVVHVCGEQVLEITLEGLACLRNQFVSKPTILKYGPTSQGMTEREVTVEQFDLGETSIICHGDRIAVDLDLANKQLPPLTQVRFVQITSERNLEHESFAITNPDGVRVSGDLEVVLYSVGRSSAF